MDVEVIVETPRGSRNKHEADHHTGDIWLDRLLFTATQYPADYGFIIDTLADDGDPLDDLMPLDEPTSPGCHIRGRVVGPFRMRDEKGDDAKVLTVPSSDTRWEHVRDLGWAGAAEAVKTVERSRRAAISGAGAAPYPPLRPVSTAPRLRRPGTSGWRSQSRRCRSALPPRARWRRYRPPPNR